MERRQRERLTLRRPVAGELSVMQDVMVHMLGPVDATVVTTTPVVRGEQMVLQVEEDDGAVSSVVVQEVARRPVVVEGQLGHRLRLEVVQSQTGDPPVSRETTRFETQSLPRIGALIRRLAIRVLNISPAGCLVESTIPIDDGAVGLLALEMGGRLYRDPVRITRVVRLRGGIWSYRLGAELLTLTPPGEATLRRVVLLEGAEMVSAAARHP